MNYKQVIVSIKTEADGAIVRSDGQPDQKYLTLEAAVEATTAWLHGLGETTRLIGLIDIEEG